MHDARETRHVVWTNLGMLTNIGLTVASPEFPIERDAVGRRERDTRRNGRTLCAAQSWSGMAEQAVAGRRGSRRWPGRCASARPRVDCGVGPGRREPCAGGRAQVCWRRCGLRRQTSIADLVALIRGAAVMVSGDTGPTQIAAAVGTPIVGIYGPTRPSRNGPWSPSDVAVSRADVCRCHHLTQLPHAADVPAGHRG